MPEKFYMQIVNKDIEKYINDLNILPDPVLKEMAEYGDEKNFPYVGPLVGRILMQYAVMINAHRIFELGSGYGYSAAWFMLGMGTGGDITCTDNSEENVNQASEFLPKLNTGSEFRYIKGDALESIDQTAGEFDIILNDIDKNGYVDAIEKAIPRIRKGGLFIADNTLWKGRVTKQEADETTETIKEFNSRLFSDNRVITTILPVRDGLTICLKK